MTDVKGNRNKPPSQQADPDMYVSCRRTKDGVYGCKGASDRRSQPTPLIVMPPLRLQSDEADYAIVGALPVDADGITLCGWQAVMRHALPGR
jgi:4-hydroxybutyryl-CoA dehydratase/vinylacetyl-CoA-Delta-isomerase